MCVFVSVLHKLQNIQCNDKDKYLFNMLHFKIPYQIESLQYNYIIEVSLKLYSSTRVYCTA
jgi:hypothetical protein